MTSYDLVARHDRDMLGEGPMWSARGRRLFWVDIVGRSVRALDPDSGAISRWAMPEPVGWIVECAVAGRFLVGLKSGVASVTLDPLTIEPRLAPEPERPHNRLNDAKVDAAGRLWFGSKDDRDEDASGALYRLDPDGGLQRMDDGYLVANGPAFSPDGRYCYHTDSGRRLVYAFALGEDGSLGERKVLIAFEEGWGYPDGMTTDAEGFLWIAHWAGGRVSRFDPAGRLVRSWPLPAANITSCAFAGEGLDRLFVTSAALDSPGSEFDGALFEIDPGVTGMAPNLFAGL